MKSASTAKKLRYLIDVTSSFYDADDLECVLTPLKKLQRVLGDFNDAQIQETRLLECARTVGAREDRRVPVLALGRLAERSRQRRDRLYPEAANQLAPIPRTRHTRAACRRAFKRRTREGASTMKVVAIYNMKGGVGKTTTAVNLSYLAAAGGKRDVLLWDLDPQAAASFAFRVRPCIKGFSKKSLESGQALVEAIKETDYANLHLLPADFAYRKLDRFLDHLGKPKRVVTDAPRDDRP